MADPFSLATGVISLVVVTLQIIAGVSRKLDKTIAAHRVADEELERLRRNLEKLQRRMESNYGKLESLASNTKDRGFKKLLKSDAGQAAVVRLCEALKETQRTLKRLTDQSESDEATLRASALPSNKKSLAFVRVVLKYNVSPQTIDEMISNLRDMQTEVQDCLGNLETCFNDVDDFLDFFHRQLVRVSTSGSLLSTSTTLTARVLLVNWLEKFGRRRGSSEGSRNESRTLHTFLQADQEEDDAPLTLPQGKDLFDLLEAEIKVHFDNVSAVYTFLLPRDSSGAEIGRLPDSISALSAATLPPEVLWDETNRLLGAIPALYHAASLQDSRLAKAQQLIAEMQRSLDELRRRLTELKRHLDQP